MGPAAAVSGLVQTMGDLFTYLVYVNLIMRAGGEADAYQLWHKLSDERNRYYLNDVEDDLIGRAKSGTP